MAALECPERGAGNDMEDLEHLAGHSRNTLDGLKRVILSEKPEAIGLVQAVIGSAYA